MCRIRNSEFGILNSEFPISSRGKSGGPDAQDQLSFREQNKLGDQVDGGVVCIQWNGTAATSYRETKLSLRRYTAN